MVSMLKDILSKDIIANHLINKIILSKTQIDTILIEISKKKDLNLDKRLLLRDNGKVSKGSFLRTYKQAKNNIEKTIYTLIFLQYISVLDDNNISNLIKISNILNEISNSNSNSQNINEVFNQLSTVISNIIKINI